MKKLIIFFLIATTVIISYSFINGDDTRYFFYSYVVIAKVDSSLTFGQKSIVHFSTGKLITKGRSYPSRSDFLKWAKELYDKQSDCKGCYEELQILGVTEFKTKEEFDSYFRK